MWNPRGPVPETLRLLVLPALVLALGGAAACGPSNDSVPASYLVVFTLSGSPEDLNTLKFRVTYEGGDFDGTGTSVNCELFESENDETADFDDDDSDTLDVDIDASTNPLVEGNDIVGCEFVASAQPTSDHFTIEVLAATDDADDAVDPGDIDVVVTSTDTLE